MKEFQKPAWGFAELVIVYIGILLIGFVVGISGELVERLFNLLKIPLTKLSFFYVGFFIQFIATISLVLLMTIWLNRAKLTDLGLNLVSKDNFIKYGLFGGLVLIIIIFLLGLPISHFNPELEPQLYEQMLRAVISGNDFILLFIIGALLAPLAEELFYRGMVYPVFRHKLGPIPAMIMAGTLFGIVHFDSWRVIPLAVGGIILCYIYEKTNSILVTTMAHGVWNGLMTFLVLYII